MVDGLMSHPLPVTWKMYEIQFWVDLPNFIALPYSEDRIRVMEFDIGCGDENTMDPSSRTRGRTPLVLIFKMSMLAAYWNFNLFPTWPVSTMAENGFRNICDVVFQDAHYIERQFLKLAEHSKEDKPLLLSVGLLIIMWSFQHGCKMAADHIPVKLEASCRPDRNTIQTAFSNMQLLSDISKWPFHDGGQYFFR